MIVWEIPNRVALPERACDRRRTAVDIGSCAWATRSTDSRVSRSITRAESASESAIAAACASAGLCGVCRPDLAERSLPPRRRGASRSGVCSSRSFARARASTSTVARRCARGPRRRIDTPRPSLRSARTAGPARTSARRVLDGAQIARGWNRRRHVVERDPRVALESVGERTVGQLRERAVGGRDRRAVGVHVEVRLRDHLMSRACSTLSEVRDARSARARRSRRRCGPACGAPLPA